MSSDTIVFIIVLAIGVVLVCISIFIQKQNGGEDSDRASVDGFVTVDKVNQDLLQSISDADSAIEQLHSMSEMILNEVSDKYKELLFLYQLIDEKKTELEKLRATEHKPTTFDTQQQVKVKTRQHDRTALADTAVNKGVNKGVTRDNNTAISNDIDKDVNAVMIDFNTDMVKAEQEVVNKPSISLPTTLGERYKVISEMKNSGKTIHQIAKELSIGQGEVQLILDLARAE